ncbi:formate dehydrogenase H [Escherichia coli]|uniref:Uncharacterized protein YtcA n=1 Tax=Escherichia coli TaxID=562 RepID=A0A377DZP4_ECOLX|nr:formate dehydrogenase H [Escherichia coli]
MPTVLSRMAMQLKKTAWIIPVFMVSGCSLSPAIPVIGAYYPSWFFCAIASLILTLITRRVIQRANINLAFCRNYLYRPFCSLRHAVLAGIFSNLFETRLMESTPKKSSSAVNSLLC